MFFSHKLLGVIFKKLIFLDLIVIAKPILFRLPITLKMSSKLIEIEALYAAAMKETRRSIICDLTRGTDVIKEVSVCLSSKFIRSFKELSVLCMRLRKTDWNVALTFTWNFRIFTNGERQAIDLLHVSLVFYYKGEFYYLYLGAIDHLHESKIDGCSIYTEYSSFGKISDNKSIDLLDELFVNSTLVEEHSPKNDPAFIHSEHISFDLDKILQIFPVLRSYLYDSNALDSTVDPAYCC